MKNMVIFRDNQELDSDDLNNLQSYARSSFDTLVSDAIANDPRYTGFTATKTAATQVTLTAGRLYNAGAVYELGTPTVIDFFSQLPLVTQKWCAIVVNGNDIQTNVQPRDFLTDATTGATQPQSVAMEDSRIAVINSVSGVESPQPSYPTTDVTVTVIAYVLLSTTGVVQIVQFTDSQLPQLEAVEGQVTDIDNWRQQIGAQVDTLGTSLANIQAALKGFALQSDFLAMLAQMNNIAQLLSQLSARLDALAIKVSQPAEYIFYGRNYFLDNSGSDVTNGSFTASINEGVRFASGASSTSQFALLNPLDPNAAVSSGYVIPAYTPKLRLSCTGYASELQIGQYVYQSARSCRLLTRRRNRQRCGPTFAPGQAANWWQSGAYDPVALTLAYVGESAFVTYPISEYVNTIDPAQHGLIRGSYGYSRLSEYWQDDYSAPHWERITSSVNVSGQQVAQTFLNAQDGWLCQIGLFFTRVAATGDVDLKLCYLDAQNRPDLTNVITSVNVPVANLKVGSISSGGGLPSLVETLVPIPPTFLEGGQRYGVVATTSGQHYFAMTVTDALVLQGNYFYCDSSQTFIVDSTRNIRLNIYYAHFAAAYYELQLQSLSLSGGIASIDVIAEREVPSTCSLTYQVQIAGVWYPLAAVPGPGFNFGASPQTLLPLKAVFAGTTDLMPGLGLTQSQVQIAAAQATAATYLSTTQTLGSASQNIKISVVLEDFDSSHHTCTVTLNSGGSYSATSVTDTVQADGSLRRDCVFTLGSTITSYVIEIAMATSLSGSTFHIAELDQYAV